MTYEAELRAKWAQRSDLELLAELRAVEPLPAEEKWIAAHWQRAAALITLAGLAAERHLAAAVPLALEGLGVGDPNEAMGTLWSHFLEAVNRDVAELVGLLQRASKSPRPGARFWAAAGLGVFAGDEALDALEVLVADADREVAAEACHALTALATRTPAARTRVRERLTALNKDRHLASSAAGALYDLGEFEAAEVRARELDAADEAGLPLRTLTTIRRCVVKLKQCPQRWEALEPTAAEQVKHCAVCARDVYFCQDDAETLQHAALGHCIARLLPEPLSNPPPMYLGRPRIHIETHPRDERVLSWSAREGSIAEALGYDLAKVERRCPECSYPVPDWRKSCYVCGFTMGSV